MDELTARHTLLATASTPVVHIADEATIARYVERLHAVLATGTPNAQRAFLRAWIPRIEADGMKLAVTFTLPAILAGSPANNGENFASSEVLPLVANGDPNGIRTRVGEMKTRCPDLARRWDREVSWWAARESNP